MRIGDNYSFHIRPPFPDPTRASRKAILDTFVLTREVKEIISRIFQRLESFPAAQPGYLLLTGHPGVGKTHLLRYLGYLLEAPHDPAWAPLQSLCGGVEIVKTSNLYICLPKDPEVDLGRFLVQRVCHLSDWEAGSAAEMPIAEVSSRIRDAAQTLRTQNLGFVAIDDFSQRADTFTGSEQLKREVRIVELLASSLAEIGILVCLVGSEKHFSKEAGADNPEQNGTDRHWEPVRIRRNNVMEVISSALASKNDVQREKIQSVLKRLRRQLPLLGSSLETLVDLYPIHPGIFPALFKLRSIIPGFSPLQFAHVAIKAARTRSAERLVGVDLLLDFILPELHKREDFWPVIASFEEFQSMVIPQLRPSIQEKADTLLKAITFMTLCEYQAPTVTALANSTLLYDESEMLPSYSLGAALLMEMEQYGGRYLSVGGVLRDRSYRLKGSDKHAALSPERLLEEEVFRVQFPIMFFEWLQNQVPSWKPDTSPKYQRSSQSIPSSIPGLENGPLGFVHLKSVADSLWSEEDLSSLKEDPAQWILLILSPLERYYELDSSLQEMAANLPNLLIWRPDCPTAGEAERLHALTLTSPEERSREAEYEIRRILDSVFAGRGKLITGTKEWRIADEIGSQQLQPYLAGKLRKLVLNSTAVPATTAPPEDGSKFPRDEKTALHWAALLSGLDGIRGVDLSSATEQLLAWWATNLDLDPGLSVGDWPEVPESFLTTKFSEELRFFNTCLDQLRPLLGQLRNGETELRHAMRQVAIAFSRQETRLRRWRRLLDRLPSLMQWLPSYAHAQSYLSGVYPTDRVVLEQNRENLLSAMRAPIRFMDPAERDRFDREFLEFKKGYSDYYCALHEGSRQFGGKQEGVDLKLDSVSLMNLERLSTLAHSNKSYLNRVRIIGKWIQANRCPLPAREILDSHPRCYCNFDPIGGKNPSELANQVNGIIQEGIDYFRKSLRGCSSIIIQELKSQGVDDRHARQIAALLSHGPMIPLHARSIEVLNRMIDKHRRPFLKEFTKTA